MEWKIDITGITGAGIERAKVEAQRAIAEQLETLNNTIDTGFGLVIDELVKLNKTLENINYNLAH